MEEKEKKAHHPDPVPEQEQKDSPQTPQAPEKGQEEAHDEDEINLDFSRIKNLFKSKGGEEKEKLSSAKPDENSSEKTSAPEKDDDEISLDLSKLKNLFGGKKDSLSEGTPEIKNTETHPPAEKAPHSDDEISFDFSKIKQSITGLFSKEKTQPPSPQGKSVGEDDLNVDWKKAGEFIKRYGTFFVVLIPFILAIYLRMMSVDLPMTDYWAQQSVLDSIRSQVDAQISQQYPNLPPANRQSLVNSEVQKQIEQNAVAVERQIESTSNFFKQYFRDPDGINYMPDIDPYYWQRYAKNILDQGHPGDELRDGRPYDTYQLAPVGRFVTGDMFHSYFLAFFHRFVSVLDPSVILRQSVSLYPVVIAAISTVLVFLIAAKITGNLGGLVAAIFFTINSTFLGRTLYGHGDSDAWVLFFPVFVAWLFFEIFDRDKLWKAAVVAAGAAGAVGLYSYAWNGWWYIFDFILVASGAAFVYLLISHFSELRQDWRKLAGERDMRNLVVGVLVFLLLSFVFISIAASPGIFFKGLLGPIQFSSIKDPVDDSLWPNVLTTVAELNTGTVGDAINSTGGKPLFFLSALGILLIFLRRFGTKELTLIGVSALFYAVLVFQGAGLSTITFTILMGLPWGAAFLLTLHEKGGSMRMLYGIVLALWFLASVYAVSKGVRFTLMLAPSFAIALGTAVARIHTLFVDWSESGLKINRALSSALFMGVLLIWIFAGPVNAASQSASQDIPIINDVWWNSLQSIENNSSQDAIITSWWDFGHHFKLIADRPVTFDGTTQTHQPAHWVGKMFMIPDERKSFGILRMLDCGSNRGFMSINDRFDDTVRSVDVLDTIVSLEREEAKDTLEQDGFSTEEAEEILEYTHCVPPEGFVIASEDMIGKSGVWAHFGSWDFVRADVWFNAKNLPVSEAVPYLTDRYNMTEQEAENLYFEARGITSNEEANRWVAPWPGYGSQTSCVRTEENPEIFACDNGFQFNYTSKDMWAVSQGQTVHPDEIAYVTRSGLERRSFSENTIGAGMTLIPAGSDSFRGIVSSPELVGSLFTKMFHMDGHGLRHFDLFYKERGLTGTDVRVYKADWQSQDVRIVEQYVDYLDQIENRTVSLSGQNA